MKGKESGQALIMVLVILALGTLLVFPTLVQAYTSQRYHQLVERNTSNAYTADSGIEYGYWQVYNNVEDVQKNGWQQSFAINDATVNVTAEYVWDIAAYKITSTATSASNRSMTIVSYVVIDIGLFGNAFACDGNLNINQSDLTGDAACDVYANGNISLNQANVDGDVTAARTVSLNQSTVTGEITEDAPVLDFPPIDPQPHIDAALEGGPPVSSITWNNQPDKTLGPKYINGNLNVTKTNVTLTGTVYVTGYVNINESNFSGFGDIVAQGYIKLTKTPFTVTDPDTLPLVMSINSYIDISQSAAEYDVYAVLYAPTSSISLTHVHVYGAVAADTITVNQAQVFYPASVEGRPDLPGAGMETITYGYK